MAIYNPADNGWKQCPRCTRWLRLHCYGRNRSARDGLTSYCRDCKRLSEAEWKAGHRDRWQQIKRDSRQRRGVLVLEVC